MKKYSHIRLLFTDVDGTLTDGKLYYGPEGEMMKVFHVKDGKALVDWNAREGYVAGMLSAKDSLPLRARAAGLGLSESGFGIEDKLSWMETWLSRNGFSWEQLAYMGDDLNDVDLMKAAGASAAPADAVEAALLVSDYKCNKKGGEGALREFAEFLLSSV